MNILVLRSYGDYAIMLNAIQHSTAQKPIHLIVSKHLQPLHEALNLTIPENYTIEFVDFKIRNGILGIFTNKHFFSLHSLKEILSIKKYFANEKMQLTYLEHKKRPLIFHLFSKLRVRGIYDKGNIYESFNSFFESTSSPNRVNKVSILSNVIIFPDSRKSNKQIDNNTLNNLCQMLAKKKLNVLVAKHNLDIINNCIDRHYELKGYYNFQELVELVKNADYIFSSDSLPVHIAEIFNKPHWILYNSKINSNWLTPSSKLKHNYCTFDEIQLINNILN